MYRIDAMKDLVRVKAESEAQKTLVYEIFIDDDMLIDDPDSILADPIGTWQQSESGKYIMEHSNPSPKWVKGNSMINCESYSFFAEERIYSIFGATYKIIAYLTPEEVTYWTLKFS